MSKQICRPSGIRKRYLGRAPQMVSTIFVALGSRQNVYRRTSAFHDNRSIHTSTQSSRDMLLLHCRQLLLSDTLNHSCVYWHTHTHLLAPCFTHVIKLQSAVPMLSFASCLLPLLQCIYILNWIYTHSTFRWCSHVCAHAPTRTSLFHPA